jgi:hypothetical protein
MDCTAAGGPEGLGSTVDQLHEEREAGIEADRRRSKQTAMDCRRNKQFSESCFKVSQKESFENFFRGGQGEYKTQRGGRAYPLVGI